jgi:nitrate reductase NapAB chaperone NapD
MPISGIGVSVQPQFLEKVKNEIRNNISGEVARTVGDYLVVVLETETPKEMEKKFEAILQLPEVTTAWVAYHSVEDVAVESSL